LQLARGRWRRAFQEPPALLRGQPVPEANAYPPHALHATNAGGQFGAQEAGVGCLIRNAPYGSEPKVDRGRRISPLFEVNPVTEHDGAVEGEARLRTVPGNELANRVLVSSLAAGRRQAVQDGRLGVFEVGKRQNALRRLLLASVRLGHRRRPPSPSPTASTNARLWR